MKPNPKSRLTYDDGWRHGVEACETQHEAIKREARAELIASLEKNCLNDVTSRRRVDYVKRISAELDAADERKS